MGTAAILHVISTFAVMIPSFATNLPLMATPTPGVLVTWLHIIVGITAESIALAIVFLWGFKPPPEMTCPKRKKFMRQLLAFLTTAAILGIAYYYYILP